MEFPHHHHHHHHRRNDDDGDRPEHYPPPPPPPSSFDRPPPPPPPPAPVAPPPPPSSVDEPPSPHHCYQDPPPRRPHYEQQEYEKQQTHVFHSPPVTQNPDFPSNYQPPEVTRVSHDQTHHSLHPHLPSVFHQGASETQTGTGPPVLDLSNKPSFKVYCKAEPDFLLTIREGTVVLARADPSDQFQKWYKDEKYSTQVKDEDGFPCFALVNKATGQAMKHSIGATHPVRLIPYNPDILDESILWTGSKDLGDGYRAIRMVNNIRLNLDAFHGDKKSGGVHQGTTIVLCEWNKGDNQRWKVAQLN